MRVDEELWLFLPQYCGTLYHIRSDKQIRWIFRSDIEVLDMLFIFLLTFSNTLSTFWIFGAI